MDKLRGLIFNKLTHLTCISGLILLSTLSFAQTPVQKVPLTRILFVFDCSQSMFGRWESGIKMDISKRIFSQALDSLKDIPNLELALRMYGHQSPLKPQRDCQDTKLEVPFGKKNIDKMKSKIQAVNPKGTTPIAYTLEKCGNDFPPCADCRNIIVLITDGVEECEGDPCAVSLALQKKGIVLKPFVIGVGLDVEFKKTFECVGNYFDAASESSFKNALNVIITQALNSTTAQVNLLDKSGQPTETNVNMTFYDSHSGLEKYNYIHTINNKGVPDTIPLDPIFKYNLIVHTIPPVEKKDIVLTPGKHTIIGLDAPQGSLIVKANGLNEYKNLQFIIRKKGEANTLNVQSINRTEKYIIGKYDLEILSLPRINVKDVDISQSHTTTIQIPQPGIANILSNGPGYGSLYVEEKNELKWIYNFEENLNRETLTLQPGRYKAVYRSKGAKQSIYTIERPFKIESGGSVTVKLF